MKKTTFLLLALFALPTQEGTAQQPTPLSIGGDAKVGLIVTGTGNTINTTQIFGKSPEYAELKKSLETLEADIQKKAAVCEKMAKDNLPAEYRDGCRAELIALNARRDSVQKIETRFREDVIRLAESFSKIELNSERLRLAKKFFEEGKISEADNVLKEKDMAATGDAALAAKARNDSVLLQTANEFALKARLKALKMDYDSAQILFEQSRKYFETVDNLWDFGILLNQQNQAHLAIEYCEKALKLAGSKSQEATMAMSLGTLYSNVQKPAESEKMYLRSLEIYERLTASDPTQFELDLALACMSLGAFYSTNQKPAESEKMLLRYLEICERLAASDPAQFEPDLAWACLMLGLFYSDVQKMAESEKMYLRSLEIFERLAASTPAQFELGLASTCMGLGVFYSNVQKMAESEKMYLRSLEIHERLAASNPAQFEPDLAVACMNLGFFYSGIQKPAESEKMYLRSLEICERLVASNPAQFEPYLALTLNNFGSFRQTNGQFEEAKKMYGQALTLHQKAVASGQTYFWEELNQVYQNMAALRDSFESRSEWAAVVAIQRERAVCMDALSKVHPKAAENAPQDYGSLSGYCLFARQYPESQSAAERSLTLDPSQNLARANLGHSHLLRGEWDKAKQVYEQFIAGEKDPAEAKKTLAKDWDDLEKARVTHPVMEKARAWVKE